MSPRAETKTLCNQINKNKINIFKKEKGYKSPSEPKRLVFPYTHITGLDFHITMQMITAALFVALLQLPLP